MNVEVLMTGDELTDLVAEGDVAAVGAALDAGVDPNLTDADGESALAVAVATDHRELVELLLVRGANPNPTTGYAPLYLAHEAGLIALLLDKGARPNWQTANGETPLTFAAHDGQLDAVELLLASGADPSLPSTDWPPLFYAAMGGHLEIVKALAAAGADLLRVHDGSTALTIAVDHRRWAIAELLLDRAPAIAGLGDVDPEAVARGRTQPVLADRIATHRWSEVAEGLRGRLRISPPPAKDEPYRVVGEIENVGAEVRSIPIDTPWCFTWRLTCDGEDVATDLGRADIAYRLGWHDIAPGARVELQVSGSRQLTASVDPLDLVTIIWTTLPQGTLHLNGTYRLEFDRRFDDVPKTARALTLAFPSCRLPFPA